MSNKPEPVTGHGPLSPKIMLARCLRALCAGSSFVRSLILALLSAIRRRIGRFALALPCTICFPRAIDRRSGKKPSSAPARLRCIREPWAKTRPFPRDSRSSPLDTRTTLVTILYLASGLWRLGKERPSCRAAIRLCPRVEKNNLAGGRPTLGWRHVYMRPVKRAVGWYLVNQAI